MSVIDANNDSIQRRILFAGDFQYFLFSLLNKRIENPLFYRALEFLAQSCYDFLECLRTRSFVINFGRPSSAVSYIRGQLAQHPRYRTYWHDYESNSTVGMHIGVDFIKNGDYYPVDLNLNAALRPERRELYDTKIDPFFEKLLQVALSNGYRKVVCFADAWLPQQVSELDILSRMSGINLIAACPSRRSPKGVRYLPTVPEQLEANTLYIIFNYQHSPLDFFITNQSCTAYWLKDAILSYQGVDKLRLGYVDTSPKLKDLELSEVGQWPNLVVKLGGGWSGNFVKIAKVRNKEEARPVLRMTSDDIPRVFKRSLLKKMSGWAGHHHSVLFQKFIPPELNDNGYPQIIRSHLLLTPVMNEILSCHRVISQHKPPKNLDFGLIKHDRSFIVNFSKGAQYERVDQEQAREIKIASIQLAHLIKSVLKERFMISSMDNLNSFTTS
jgi:hypothetical protein